MGLSEQFTNLGEDMIASFNERVNFLGKNIVDTHRFLNDCRKSHKAMGKKLRAELGAFTDHLTETVDQMRHKFQKEQHQAHQAWQRVTKTMAAKRHNFKSDLTRSKQSAARVH